MRQRTAFGQHTLPSEYFTSDEIFRAERERIFHRSWLLAGHVSQIATPGSFFLFELDGESVMVVSDVDEQGGIEAVAAIRDAGHDATFVRANVAEWSDCRAMVAAAVSAWAPS